MTAPSDDQVTVIRTLIGDASATPKIDDDTLALFWDLSGANLYETAALLADSLAGRYATSTSFSVEGLSISNATKAGNYRELAGRLRGMGQRAPGALGAPFVGGISRGEIQQVESDLDRTPSRATMGRDDQQPDAVFLSPVPAELP